VFPPHFRKSFSLKCLDYYKNSELRGFVRLRIGEEFEVHGIVTNSQRSKIIALGGLKNTNTYIILFQVLHNTLLACSERTCYFGTKHHNVKILNVI
jgi:hypothetical protein